MTDDDADRCMRAWLQTWAARPAPSAPGPRIPTLPDAVGGGLCGNINGGSQ